MQSANCAERVYISTNYRIGTFPRMGVAGSAPRSSASQISFRDWVSKALNKSSALLVPSPSCCASRRLFDHRDFDTETSWCGFHNSDAFRTNLNTDSEGMCTGILETAERRKGRLRASNRCSSPAAPAGKSGLVQRTSLGLRQTMLRNNHHRQQAQPPTRKMPRRKPGKSPGRPIRRASRGAPVVCVDRLPPPWLDRHGRFLLQA